MEKPGTGIIGEDVKGNGTIIAKETSKRKFMNGWTKSQEELMAAWADIAACYRWMHDKAEKRFSHLNLSMSIPIIILSTLTGTANFGIDSIVGDNLTHKKYASFIIGSVSLITGILGTLSNFLRFAQFQESHRVASVSWGKFQRLIAVELALHPNDRADCMDFLKLCRAELDRLIEQSPAIPPDVINAFENKFGKMEKIEKPEICGDIDHTKVYCDNNGRLQQIASDTVMFLRQRRKFMTELINDEIEKKIYNEINKRLASGATINKETNAVEQQIEIVISPKNEEKQEKQEKQENIIKNKVISIIDDNNTNDKVDDNSSADESSAEYSSEEDSNVKSKFVDKL
jgi:hypothetical protein